MGEEGMPPGGEGGMEENASSLHHRLPFIAFTAAVISSRRGKIKMTGSRIRLTSG